MASSFFNTKKDAAFAAGSKNFATRISASPTSVGLNVSLASQYSALDAAFQAAYAAANVVNTRSKGLIIAKNVALKACRAEASLLAKLINGTASVTDQQKNDLGLSVPATPAPRPAPGTPNDFTSSVSINGVLTTKWKCDTKRVGGTIYQVYRAVNDSTDFAYLGGTGEKKFVDDTVPTAATSVTYQVQATRSTGVSEFGQYQVHLGGAVTGADAAKARDAMAAAVKLAA